MALLIHTNSHRLCAYQACPIPSTSPRSPSLRSFSLRAGSVIYVPPGTPPSKIEYENTKSNTRPRNQTREDEIKREDTKSKTRTRNRTRERPKTIRLWPYWPQCSCLRAYSVRPPVLASRMLYHELRYLHSEWC
eukprot:3773346-Rhodomonas_salina.3